MQVQLPSRRTIAAGIAGLVTWGLGLLLGNLGVSVPQEDIGAAVALVAAIASHFCPDSIQDQAKALNVDVKALAAWLPQQVYPDQGTKGG